MLRSHKNLLYEAVQEMEFPIEKLETRIQKFHAIQESTSKTIIYDCFVIRVKDTPFEFWVRNEKGEGDSNAYSEYYSYRFTNIDVNQEMTKWSTEIYNIRYKIADIVKVLRYWLSAYMGEEEITDLWEQAQTKNFFEFSPAFTPEDLRPFTVEERAQIKNSLKEFQRLLLDSIHTTDEQNLLISQRLGYLEVSVDRLNAFDWKSVAIAVVSGILINLAVDTETGVLIFQLFERAFKNVVKLIG